MINLERQLQTARLLRYMSSFDPRGLRVLADAAYKVLEFNLIYSKRHASVSEPVMIFLDDSDQLLRSRPLDIRSFCFCAKLILFFIILFRQERNAVKLCFY